VWAAGPGTVNPGALRTSDTTSLTRRQAQALAIDLFRHSTSAEGGFCTFQPVVDGAACPLSLTATAATSSSSRALTSSTGVASASSGGCRPRAPPDDATADYLHRYFQPTARAAA
jgi:hypothetical protein